MLPVRSRSDDVFPIPLTAILCLSLRSPLVITVVTVYFVDIHVTIGERSETRISGGAKLEQHFEDQTKI